MFACSWGKEDVVKLLLEREDIDIRLKNMNGKTAYDLCTDGISEAVRNRLNHKDGGLFHYPLFTCAKSCTVA
jgi:ankyrin repeat protein